MARLNVKRFRVAGFLWVTGVFGCGPNTFYPGLKIAPEVLLERVTVVAVAPLASDSIQVPDSIAFAFEDRVVEQLRTLGFSVIAPAEYQGVWDDLYDSLDVRDAETGAEDSVRLERAQRAFFAKLEDEWDVDAIAFLEVWEVVARYTHSVADWDGTSQAVADAGVRVADVLTAALAGVRGNTLAGGNVVAVSFGVVIETLGGDGLYESGGGIQVRDRVSVGQGGWYRVSDEDIFNEPLRNERAVDIALRELIGPVRKSQ